MSKHIQKIRLSDLPRHIAEVIKAVPENDERLAIMDGRKRVAWIVGEYDIGTLKYHDRREDAFDIKAARAARLEEGAIPFEQVKRDLGLE